MNDSNVLVIKNGAISPTINSELTPVNTGDFSKWSPYVQLNSTGDYFVLIDLADSNGSWSNWNVSDVEVDPQGSTINAQNMSAVGDQGNVNWGLGLYPCSQYSYTINGALTDGSGNPLRKVEISIDVHDENETSGYTSTISTTATTDGTGHFSVSPEFPIIQGALTFDNTVSRHYYDVDEVTVLVNGKTVYSTHVYAMAYQIPIYQ